MANPLFNRDEYVDLQNQQNGHILREFVSIHASIDRSNNLLDALNDEMLRHIEMTLGRFHTLTSRFDEVDARFDALNSRFDQTNEAFDIVDGRFMGVGKSLDDLNTCFNKIERRLDFIELRFDKFEKRLDLEEFRSEKTVDRLDDIQERLDDIEERLDAVDARFDGVEGRLDKIEKRLDHVELDLSRLNARFQNSNLRNPRLPIVPIPIFDFQRATIIQPDPKRYPKNAYQFFALQSGKTQRHRDMLKYLIEIYDVPVHNLIRPYRDFDEDDSFDESESETTHLSQTPQIDLDELDTGTRVRVVEFLEPIFGLRGDKIRKFIKAAAAKRAESPPGAPKRALQDVDETSRGSRAVTGSPDRKTKKPNLDQRREGNASQESSEKDSCLPLRNTSSESQIDRPKKDSDWGSTTNRNSTRSDAKHSDDNDEHL